MEILLKSVSKVISSYQQDMEQSGEYFNIFQLLGLDRNEVRTHSAFIASLLDPKGTHGCGNRFLDEFISLMTKRHPDLSKRLVTFKTDRCYVKIEYYIGGDVNGGGGRLDILLIDQNENHIIIENKIYAGDQLRQLYRYHEFDKNAIIFYLTLSGDEPSKDSSNGLMTGKDFFCISYQQDITEWLKEFMNKSLHFAGLTETIKQYLHLIKTLTHQTSSNKMNDEIVLLLKSSDENIEASFHIAENIEQLKVQRGIEIAGALLKKLHPYLDYLKPSEYYFEFPRIEIYPLHWKNHLIGFTSEGGFFFGIKRINAENPTISFEQVKEFVGNDWKTSPWWLCSKRDNNGVNNLYSISPWLKKNEDELTDIMLKWILEMYNKSKPLDL